MKFWDNEVIFIVWPHFSPFEKFTSCFYYIFFEIMSPYLRGFVGREKQTVGNTKE